MKKRLNIIKLIILSLMLISLSGCSFLNSTNSSNNLLKIAKEENQNDTMYVGAVSKLTTNILEIDASAVITWSSSDPSIISVSQEGIVEAKKVGQATISAATDSFEAKRIINVVSKQSTNFINISGEQTISVSGFTQLTATVVSDDEKTITWSSSNEEIAVVGNDGNVLGVSKGLCTITATLDSDNSIYCDYVIYVQGTSTKDVIDRITYETNGTLDLIALSDKIKEVVNKSTPAVVGVSNYQTVTSAGQSVLARSGVGTGVIYNRKSVNDGYEYTLLTNYHVIEDNEAIKIYMNFLDEEIPATVVRYDEVIDLAIVKFTSTLDITPLEFGTSDDVNVGGFVIAIGNANGYDYYGSVTFGIVSYPERVLASNPTVTYIQHDAAINPGNSGGPLFNMDGKIIGINTLKLAASDIDNMGFAISIISVLDFLDNE